jgi:hypothetical protein
LGGVLAAALSFGAPGVARAEAPSPDPDETTDMLLYPRGQNWQFSPIASGGNAVVQDAACTPYCRFKMPSGSYTVIIGEVKERFEIKAGKATVRYSEGSPALRLAGLVVAGLGVVLSGALVASWWERSEPLGPKEGRVLVFGLGLGLTMTVVGGSFFFLSGPGITLDQPLRR